jgi:site-specific recombinase XerD
VKTNAKPPAEINAAALRKRYRRCRGESIEECALLVEPPSAAGRGQIERLAKTTAKRRSCKPERGSLDESMFLEVDEVRALLRVITSKRDKCALLLTYSRGLRASEVGKILLSDFQRDRLYVRRGKGSVSREYSLTPEELHALRMWIRERGTAPGPLFPSRNHRPISRRRLDELMKRYCEAAKIHPSKAHMHSLKHSAGTHCLEHGGSLQDIKEILGHRKISSTEIYLHTSRKRREAMADLQNQWRVT